MKEKSLICAHDKRGKAYFKEEDLTARVGRFISIDVDIEFDINNDAILGGD